MTFGGIITNGWVWLYASPIILIVGLVLWYHYLIPLSHAFAWAT